MHDIIVAQCTPKGPGAIALLRLCGDGVFDMADFFSVLYCGKKLSEIESHSIAHGFLVDKDKKKIDNVLFLIMKAPKTFTGQDTLEITCHNNQLIVECIIETAIFYGARLAQQGEFTKRSFLNNKIDLLKAEAIHELILAPSSKHVEAALSQLDGSLSLYIKDIEKKLYQILSFAQASFEFIEEENIQFRDAITNILQEIISKIAWIKKYYNQQNRIKDGIRVSIIGSVNAGKSSLFNALLQKKRALVSDIPGTTRDTVENSLQKNGTFLTLIDTAGIRKTDDILESQGINRSYQEAESADIILLVINRATILSEQEINIYDDLFSRYKNKIIVVYTKIDLEKHTTFSLSHEPSCIIEVSEKIPSTISALEQMLMKKIEEFIDYDTPIIVSLRQFNLLLSVEQKLQAIESKIMQGSYEIIAAETVIAIEILQEVTGKTISEKSMDLIFQHFCVGK